MIYFLDVEEIGTVEVELTDSDLDKLHSLAFVEFYPEEDAIQVSYSYFIKNINDFHELVEKWIYENKTLSK